MKRHFVFTTLAMNQTEFFVGLAKQLIESGHEASIIAFHERSVDFSLSQGVSAFNIYSNEKNGKIWSE